MALLKTALLNKARQRNRTKEAQPINPTATQIGQTNQ
jgi:hypothetical protein